MGFVNFTWTLFCLFEIVNLTMSWVIFTISKKTWCVRIPVNFTANLGAIYGSKLNNVYVAFVVSQVEVCGKQY